jgi:hypothetical protein
VVKLYPRRLARLLVLSAVLSGTQLASANACSPARPEKTREFTGVLVDRRPVASTDRSMRTQVWKWTFLVESWNESKTDVPERPIRAVVRVSELHPEAKQATTCDDGSTTVEAKKGTRYRVTATRVGKDWLASKYYDSSPIQKL